MKISQSYRPSSLSEISEQDHVKSCIKRSLAEGIASSYIFLGERGVGKTSIARIFAKIANCEQFHVMNDCCNSCDCCKNISSIESFYYMEIDAASNRGVDSINHIKDIAVSGIDSNKKRFIVIDEAHMLTEEAFNSMLKILEETPENLSFILITTEYKKMPLPILSRCVTVLFNNLTLNSISDRLRAICADRKIKIENDAIVAISEHANGSMRDAESALESTLLCRKNEDAIYGLDVQNALGKLSVSNVIFIDEYRASHNIKEAISKTLSLIDKFGYKSVIGAFTNHFHNIMLFITDNEKLISQPSLESHYKNSLSLYSGKSEELKKILSSLFTIENSYYSSPISYKAWITLFVKKIVSEFYSKKEIFSQEISEASDLVKESQNKQEILSKEKLLLKTENQKTNLPPIRKMIIAEFIKQELKQ